MSVLSTVNLAEGICRRPPDGMSIDDWHPKSKSKRDRYSETANKARSNCAVCTVQVDCLRSALDAAANGIKMVGILGGLDEVEREKLLQHHKPGGGSA